MATLQFAAQAYKASSTQLISQECINAFVEPSPKDAQTPAPVFGTAGLKLFSRMGNGPILGAHIMGDSAYFISGNALYKISQETVVQNVNSGGAVPATLIGSTTIGSFASMADNASQLVMVDGNVGWIYQVGGLNQVTVDSAIAGATTIVANVTGNLTSGDAIAIEMDDGSTFNTTLAGNVAAGDGVTVTLAAGLPSALTAGAIMIDPSVVLGQIVAAAFEPANTVRYFDGYFVFNAKNTRRFFISGLNDGTQYSGLDFATASSGSRYTVAVEVYHEQLLIFCQDRTEVWWDSGNVSFPFQRYDAAEIARGLGAPYATVSEDNTVFWLADDGIFYRLNQFQPMRISTFAMEYAWSQYPQKWLDAQAFVITQQGHKFIVINFISGKATWVFDIASGLWHQRVSWGNPWV